MTKKTIQEIRKKARRHFLKAQKLAAVASSPLKRLSEEQIIEALRKTREELWEEKLASSSRHQRIHLRTGT